MARSTKPETDSKYFINMTTNRFLIVVIFFCSSLFTNAQIDSLNQFYVYNRELIIQKIEREHIPLDGKKVKMIPFRVDSLFGFVKNDEKQNWVIQPKFEQVFAVYEEGAIVKKDERYGLINESDTWLIEPNFEMLLKEKDIFHGIIDGVIDTILPEMYNAYILNAFFDCNGKFLFTEMAHDQKSFIGNDTLAWFRYGTQYRIRGKSGKLHKTFHFRIDEKFIGVCNNLLVFSKDTDTLTYYYAYDLNNKLIFKTAFSQGFVEGVYKLSDNLFGFVTTGPDYYFGDSLTNSNLHGAFSFPLGTLPSNLNYFDKEQYIVENRKTSLQGVINKKGEILIGFEYKYIGEFFNDKALCINSKGNTVLIDNKGNLIKDVSHRTSDKDYMHSLIVLHEPLRFSEGLCIGNDYVLIKGKNKKGEPEVYIQDDSTYFFYFNESGERKLVLNADIIFAGYFSEGLAPAVNSDKALGFIDKTGKWVIRPEYELAVAGAYPLPYIVVPKFINGFAYIKAFKGYIDKNGKAYFSGIQLKDDYDFSH